jgi:hypothetical protein
MSEPPEEFELGWAVDARIRMGEPAVVDDDVQEAERTMVKFARYAQGDPLVPYTGKEWYRHLREIAAGEYPLDQLPEHVRDLAEKLYYD